MSTQNETSIRCRQDGSIDTEHYSTVGRGLRNAATRDLMHSAAECMSVAARIKRSWSRLTGAVIR
jgi:hypothetical protein